MRRATAAPLGAVAACFAMSGVLAANAGAEIFVGRGVGGVQLFETQSQLLKTAGKPSEADNYPAGHGQPASTVWYYFKLGAVVGFSRGRVNDVYTASASEKTSKGVGPHSSLAEVRKAYPHIKCSHWSGGPGGGTAQSQICSLKTHSHGHTVTTTFEFIDPKAGYELNIGYA